MPEFTVTEDHIKLLRAMYIDFDDSCEYGAPAVDPKRPYGNSDVDRDIAEILGWGIPDEESVSAEEYDEWQGLNHERAWAIHIETAKALEIALRVGYFKPGRYLREQYRSNWRPA